jgi:hypothetical protein
MPEVIETKPIISRVNLALLAITTLWCVYWFFHAWHYIEDDAFIHLEFARSVANGQGFAFDGQVVAGDTAPLWVLLLVGLHAFIVKWIVAAKVLAALGAVIGFWGIYAFAERLARALPDGLDLRLFPALLVILVAASPYTCYWIFSGMEPLAAAGLACWAILLATQSRPTRASFLTGCLLAGLGPLVRPEMSFLAALLAVPLLGQWRRLEERGKRRTLVVGLLLFCGPVLAWLLYSLHAFGHLLPNTNAAKRAGEHDSVVRRLLSVYTMGFPLVLLAGAAGVVFAARRAGRVWESLRSAVRSVWDQKANVMEISAPVWIFLLWVLIATVFYIVNHTYVQTRYILVTAPGLLVLIVAGALKLSRSVGRAVYAIALLEALAISVLIARPFVRNKGIECDASAQLAAYMRDHLPPVAPVATYSIGEVAFYSQHPIIDTGGITRPEAIQYLNDPPEVQVRWAQSEGAQYFIGAKPQPDAVLLRVYQKKFISWTLNPARYDEPNRIELWKLQPLH